MQHPFAKQAPATGIVLSQDQICMLARKRGLEALAAWAAECMSLTAREASDYEQGILEAFVRTPVETLLLCRVSTDLERAGKPALSTYAGTIFANATAEAVADLEGLGSRPGEWSSTHRRDGARERRSY